MNIKKICVALLVSVSACVAQEERVVRGEIRAEATQDLSWLTVRLDSPGSQGRGETALVTFGGDFAFQKVPEGLYTLRVIDSRGDEILSQPLTVGSTNTPISVRLPQLPAERPTGETTSVARLRHRPNRKALEVARKAQKLSESGAYERSAEEWKKAVEADPEFSEAHGNLGAQYARLHRDSDAAEEFRRAIALDPATGRHQSNLAVVLARMGRFDEAESCARRGVLLDGSNALGHYVLGCVLTSRTTKVPEAIQQLQIAARQLPGAHQILA
ncbi:MAG TPA: tetratricopeptide repeat protein, partial [Bryobacteraceae bacterium]|nr:tetratricopeptide repeat protein [Bryobacteraceae bacterium]